MGRKQKKYEDLTITDDFMFGKVMREPRRCKRLLEIILGMEIQKVVFLDEQQSLNPDYEAKGIRLDIYAKDAESTVYNVEIQIENTGMLPKRSRYYQSVIDINMIEKGANYNALKRSYIIFICTFDLFGKGRHVYHFENRCREDASICLEDEAEKIFLNTKGTMDDISEDLQNLLKYFESFIPQDDYTKELDNAVMDAKEHREWRREYMKMKVWEWDIRREERAKGEMIYLVNLVCNKLKKGKTPEEITKDLEENIDRIKYICNIANQYAPDYNAEEILEEVWEAGKGDAL